MTIPNGVRLKLERARHHLDGLKSEVDRLIEHLNRDGVVRENDPSSGEYVWKINAPAPLADDASVIAGDLIHNLRSTLDHVVWSLDPTPVRRPLPEFPIYEKPGPGGDGFHGSGIQKIWTLPEEAKVLIERLQPYNGGNEPLRDIHRLDIIDKHRRLLATNYGINRFAMGATPAGGSFFLRHMTISTGRFQHGDAFARASGDNPIEEIEKMQFKLGFQVAIEEPGVSGEIVKKIGDIYQFVEQIVLPKFEPLF